MPTFASFREDLPARVSTLPDVTGLVWAGASAEPQRADEWSDHDFFLVVRSGTQEAFRRQLDWLPEFEDIAFSSRETEHGLKVVYRDGFILEFAVFDGPEVANAVLNHHAVSFGDEQLAASLHGVLCDPDPVDPLSVDDHLGLFYAQLLIGTGRYLRGERLVGGQFVRSYCVGRLLQVAKAVLPSERRDARDVLDVWRRVELEFPQFAAELDAALTGEVPEVAQRLSALGVRWFGGVSAVPAIAADVLARRLGWAIA